jgi:MCM P-loop domain
MLRELQGANEFPNKVIHWDQHEKDLINCLMARTFDDEVFKVVLGKPKSCTVAKLNHTEYRPGARWAAIEDRSESGSNKMMDIISVEMPTLSGVVEVHGQIHHVNKTVACFASKLVQSDNAAVELGAYLADLHDLCPRGATDVGEIERFLRTRSADLADHVTHIYGREEIHTAVDLVSHSVTWFELEGIRRRGWLDICIIGDTRTGKSLTARHMMEQHGLGQMFACMENVSRAGLTMGSAQRAGGAMQMRPGLFPRNNRKMLCLDEFHIMVEKGKENPMLHLQGARDNGRVSGVKVYGSHSLPSAVRLITICNWAKGRHDAFQFACQHLLALYGAPESVSRMDFALAVRGDPSDHPGDTEEKWDAELTRSLILRAWAMKENMVHIDREAIELAKRTISEWQEIYAEELPLFTPGEKVFSLLRVAIAIANLTFSYPESSIYECHVREVHVAWAREWFTKVFASLQYDQYSLKAIATRDLERPFDAELILLRQEALANHEDAAHILPQMFGQNSRQHWCSLFGMNIFEAETFFSSCIRKGLLESSREGWGNHSQIAPTKGGSKMLRNMVVLCEEYPELWTQRRMAIMAWNGRQDGPDGLIPLNLNTQQLRNYWNERIGDRPTSIRRQSATRCSHDAQPPNPNRSGRTNG